MDIFSSANFDWQKRLLSSWMQKRGLGFKSILGLTPSSCVLSVLEMATPLEEILISPDSLIYRVVTFLLLEIISTFYNDFCI